MQGKLYSIQVLRALAAIVVVFHHAIRAYTINMPGYMRDLVPSVLSASWIREGLSVGVDVFFVISGFIMVYSSQDHAEGRKTPGNFLVRRCERIYPPYIIATIILIALSAMSSRAMLTDLTFWRLLSSLALFPEFDQRGLVQPILGVGWTLSYEMYFYIAFAIALAAGGKRYLLPLTIIISSVWVLAYAISNASPVGTYLDLGTRVVGSTSSAI